MHQRVNINHYDNVLFLAEFKAESSDYIKAILNYSDLTYLTLLKKVRL